MPEVFKIVEFVNADEIARGLSPFNPEGVAFKAGRIMIERLLQLISEKKSFAFETTLSGLAYLELIKNAKSAGYDVVLFFIWLNSTELAQNRVQERVTSGGHSIPVDVIDRRYIRELKNFLQYKVIANNWYVYDNSGMEYVLIAKSIEGKKEIINFEKYKNFQINE